MGGGGANATLVQAMQARLDSLVGRPSGLIETLPRPVQRRIKYLKTLQEEYEGKEEEYQKELEELDKKYAGIYAPIMAKRAEVVKGTIEAPEDIEVEANEGSETGPAGIPEFWLGVLRANEISAAQISEKDEGVLEYLLDIRSEELYEEEECGFKLNFEFSDNPFFGNNLLTKTYHMVDSDVPELERAVGCKIDWKQGKNVTIKTLKKKTKAGRGGKTSSRAITKTEAVDSFFQFFSPPVIPEDGSDIGEEEMETLQTSLEEDYELGEVIRDELIPNAVRWYCGEIHQESDDEDNEDEEDDKEEDDEDEDDEDDHKHTEESNDSESELIEETSEAKGKRSVKLPSDKKEQPPECKQQ